MERIEEAAVLAELYEAESERSLKDFAGERAAQLWQSTACGDEADEASDALAGIIKLGDHHALVDVVVMAELPAIRKRAFGEIRDPRALAMLAKSDAPQELRTAAVARIDDGDVLRALAIDTTQKEVGLAAVEKLDDIDRLENVAQKAKNKAVRQKARKIVGEIQDAERAKKPGTPDEVKRKRAERAQLLREVEAVVETFDFAKASETVRTAEAAWAALGTDDDKDDRFTKAVERFWRRKEVHDTQARSGDELRAIEREAQAAKERAAAERAAAAKSAEPVGPAAPAAPPDPEREAEAKARRAEEDARREAQAAERAAQAKIEAERGAAIATSLDALASDMEQLAAADKTDQRAVDRVLNQSAKAFGDIAKVPAGTRDTLAERYRVARAKLVTKQGELREAEDWQRWANVPKAEALIATAKEMFEAPSTPDLGNRLRGLQALWKEVGPMPQRRSKELWDTFKQACDQVYDKVKGQRAVDNEKFADVTKVKEALIAEAEAVAESTDWVATAQKLKELQAQWKGSGHLPRKQGDELWKRFRAACDRFFERRKPQLDARHDEEAANLQKKRGLIARAQQITAGAPGTGGWGKAIGEIKDLQQEWKEIGYVPRRDADAVWTEFRAACDGLFKKRDEARDSEANAHRAEIDALKTEIDAVMTAESTDTVPRAIAVRSKARELGVLAPELEAMVRHVVQTQGDAVKGTELDPTQLRAKREKLIVRAEELLPKEAPAASGVDIAAQLKQAMQKNAFGDLRFSGRDPVEVVDELRASWREVGPMFDDADRTQTDRFEEVVARVLDSAGARRAAAEEPASDRNDAPRQDREGRRRRRDRNSGEHALSASPSGLPAVPPLPAIPVLPAMPTIPPSPTTTHVPDAAASALVSIAEPDEITATGVPIGVPIATPESITQPARLPPELAIPTTQPGEAQPPIEASTTQEAMPPVRPSHGTLPPPPMDDIDTGWDLGDEDPSAPTETPSSLEMASDGGPEGDGLDSVD